MTGKLVLDMNGQLTRVNIFVLLIVTAACIFSFDGFAKTRKKKRQVHKTSFRPVCSRLENADSPEFKRLINKLKDARNGKLGTTGILILGDSHNQCEDFGTAFALYLNDSLDIPYAGRGFVFPYSLARTSHRSDMQFGPTAAWYGCRFTKEQNDCEWGLAGWTAHCNDDSVTFHWKLNRNRFRKGDEIVLLCPDKISTDFTIQLSDTAGNTLDMGYSKNNCGFSAFMPSEGNQVEFKIKKKTQGAEFVLQGIVLRPLANGLVCGISGTNGARLDHYLQNPDFQRHLTSINPSMVLIALGTNDAFSGNFNPEAIAGFLQQLLTRIKSAIPDAAIVLVGPPDHCIRKGRVNPKTARINAVFSEIAGSLDFVFWNQQKAMGGKGSVFAWRNKKLATRDMIHFTTEGYTLQARLLGRAFKAEF